LPDFPSDAPGPPTPWVPGPVSVVELPSPPVGVVRQIQFNPDGKLISICDGGRVISWHIAAGAKTHELQLPKAKICSVAFTFDGRYLAAGASDGVVKIFRIYQRQEE
jgi:WD40 repeat protein